MLDPLVIMLCGLIAILAGILWLRLPAFLALVMASLVVAALTSDDARWQSATSGSWVELLARDADDSESSNWRLVSDELVDGEYRVAWNAAERLWSAHHGTPAESVLVEVDPDDRRRVRFVSSSVDAARLDEGAWLLARSDWESAVSLVTLSWGESLAENVTSGFRKIGLPIALAAVLVCCLLESGAAERIVESITRWFGPSRSALALVICGFIVGIPVYFDTVFFLLIPLARAWYRQTRRHYLLHVLAIVVGATMAHSLVPPTPGPLAVAEQLGVSLGMTMNAGLILGLLTVTVGYTYARWADRRWVLEPAEDSAGGAVADERTDCERASRRLPGLFWSVLPIALPVLLLGSYAVLETWVASGGTGSATSWLEALRFAGDKNAVLILAAAAALALLFCYGPADRVERRRQLQSALASGGTIILITAAGAAFGQSLREAGIGQAIVGRFPQAAGGHGLLVLSFALTALLRVAQGSATVAMITCAGIVAPLIASTTLPYHPVYLVLAIGCGSKPLPWMNDSGFWLVGKMSGMDETQTLKTFSVALTLMGIAGFLVTLLAAWLLPLL